MVTVTALSLLVVAVLLAAVANAENPEEFKKYFKACSSKLKTSKEEVIKGYNPENNNFYLCILKSAKVFTDDKKIDHTVWKQSDMFDHKGLEDCANRAESSAAAKAGDESGIAGAFSECCMAVKCMTTSMAGE